MEGKKVCILGGSEQQLPLIKEAKKRGYKVFLFDRDSTCLGKKQADNFFEFNIHEKNYQQIQKKIKEINPLFVTTIASDIAIRTVNKLVSDLNYPGNSYKTALWTTDKWKMKKKLREAGFPTTSAFLVENTTDVCEHSITYPIMVKASDRSGGRGITYLEDGGQLKETIQDAIEHTFNGKVLIEEYFEGKQYSVETISAKSNHQVVAITEEFYTGKPHFVERQHLIPARIDKILRGRIETLVYDILDEFEVSTGASHIELRINESGKINIIEIASRMGGDFRHELICRALGINYVGLLIDALEDNSLSYEEKNPNDFATILWACNKQDSNLLLELADKYSGLVVRNKVPNDTTATSTARDGTERLGYVLFFSRNFKSIKKLILESQYE